MIEVKQLTRTFKNGNILTPVLKGIDFKAEDGEFVAIMGRSGAGKSTFLYQMSLLDHPTSGEITFDGMRADDMDEAARVQYRLNHFGYVFQDYALLPELTALENVALPLLMQGRGKAAAYAEAKSALGRVGLDERLRNLPSQLSGGEQQRVSIARSTAHCPEVLFADEPTANLDSESALEVMNVFDDLHKAKQTIIMVTHERQYALHAQRIITIDDGQVLNEEKVKNASKKPK